MNHDEFILESSRLGFRLMKSSDLNNLVALDMNHEVRAHFPNGISSHHECLERIEKNRALFIDAGYCDFTVIHKDSGQFAGRAGFGNINEDEIEVGYVLLKEFWGKGLAQEALKSLLSWAQKFIRNERIIAYAPISHAASINVMKKGGMQYLKTEATHGTDCVYYEFRL